jgi:hypothetical protein
MDNNTIQQIKDTINQSASIGIVAPNDPSLDEMAAATALYLILKNANKNVSIASPSDPIVEVSNLVGINKVQKTLEGTGGSGDLTVSFPYTEGEIEKVSYTLEEGYLNIIVKAAEQGLSFDEKDVEFSRGGGAVDLVFTVGAPRLSELDKLFDTQNPDIRIINIDNKDENENYGDIVLVSPRLSSVSEGVADLALSLGFEIDEDSAQNLLSGISSATENFQSPKTSSLAFEMVAFLMKKGATRVANEGARRGIRAVGENRQQEEARPQIQSARPQVQPSQRQQASQDRMSFEERLQKRVAEEKAREERARQQGVQNRPAPQPRTAPQSARTAPAQSINEDYQDAIPSDDQAPDDWLAPKVYKGSSEV